MPSFASLSKPLTIGKGKDHKSYPPVSMKSPVLPETLHIDTSDLLVSVQSIPLPSDNYTDRDQTHFEQVTRPSWHRSDVYLHSEPGFVGGQKYQLERQEERRRLRSLGLLTTTTPGPETERERSQSIAMPTTTTTTTTTTTEKPEHRRRSSWQPAVKGKLQKRNKSKDPEKRKSLDPRPAQLAVENRSVPPPPTLTAQQQQHHSSFSRIQAYPAPPPSSGGSSCATPTSTKWEALNRHPNFSQVSHSSFGTMNGAMTSMSSVPPSLGSLVDFYDPNSLGQAFTTSPSSPVVSAINSQFSSHNPSPIGFHRPRYAHQNALESPVESTPSSPLLTVQKPLPAAPTTPVICTNVPVQQSSLVTPPDSRGNSSTSLNSSSSQKPADKPSTLQPYQPKYAAKSHATSTMPITQPTSQEPAAVPFVHLDFTPPARPFARPSGEGRKSTSETRLTTQEAKEYNAIAQATREAINNRILQSPAESSSAAKANGKPQLTPSRLSYEMRPRSNPSPDPQAGRLQIPPKSILRKPMDVTEEVPEIEEALNQRRQSLPPAQVTLATDFKHNATPTASEPVSPIQPTVEAEVQPERGRSTAKRSEEPQSVDGSRRNSISARRSMDMETPSAKHFDISKYTQDKSSKPAPLRTQKSYPPVSYKPYVGESSSSSSSEPHNSVPPVPPVPPLPDALFSVRGLSTPPPIRSDTAIESDEERPGTASESRKAGKAKADANANAIESAPARRRAPSMSEILKDLYRTDPSNVTPPAETTNEPTDWLSQLFRGKKTEGGKARSESRSRSAISTPLNSSPQRETGPKKDTVPRKTPKLDLSADGQKVQERAERQRLEVERKLMEAQNDPTLNMSPRSPRFHRRNTSITASPDLRVPGADTSSLRSASTTSVDRLDPVVGAGLNLVRTEDIPIVPLPLNIGEKKHDRSIRPSSAEVRQQLGEMTPPHEREDWGVTRSSHSNLSNTSLPIPLPQIELPASPSPQLSPAFASPSSHGSPAITPVPGRLPINAEPSPPPSCSSSHRKEGLGLCLDHRSSNSSLISLDVTKTLTRVLVVCCGCNRLHDPPSDVYRKMAQGNTSFRCPYCVHPINVLDCCSAYTSICNLIEKLNRKD
ncbi:hypothetical protein Dda_2854 [Drechslerella dactyloides]|uniref:Uncharacterized protein n=1 Tax=Drechslerella dactyloides TaxID=74499 RepID=A0AAD6J4L9_DREDA|nr:hypothetical protein Dda_2854 [Drechslerella dactyloides]